MTTGQPGFIIPAFAAAIDDNVPPGYPPRKPVNCQPLWGKYLQGELLFMSYFTTSANILFGVGGHRLRKTASASGLDADTPTTACMHACRNYVCRIVNTC